MAPIPSSRQLALYTQEPGAALFIDPMKTSRSMQCQGRTRSGQRCRRSAVRGTEFCKRHSAQARRRHRPLPWIRSRAARIVGGVTLAGSLASITTVWPRVSISPQQVVDVASPLQTNFRIQNDGYVQLRKIDLACHLRGVEAAGVGSAIYGFTFSEAQRQGIPVLRPGEGTSTQCPGPKFEGPVTAADIEIGVRYRVWVFPWTGIKRQRYVFGASYGAPTSWTERSFEE